ncbi:MAG: hypothetical protein WCK47_10660 [bacterium]|nr:hypothetical protein [Candidatus Sumerlaeota bacterium]
MPGITMPGAAPAPGPIGMIGPVGAPGIGIDMGPVACAGEPGSKPAPNAANAANAANPQ